MAMTGPQKQLLLRLSAWWYLCLGLAFTALAWRNILYEAPLSGTLLRGIIAVMFFIYGVTIWRSTKR